MTEVMEKRIKELESLIVEIKTLKAQRENYHALVVAAQAVVDRWETPLWKDVPHTGVFIHELRTSLLKLKR